VKSRHIILDGVKDHSIPHLSRNTIARYMWEALKGLFQSKNENHKKVLREKLRDTKMTGLDIVKTYLTWIQQVRDELVVVGETVVDSDLVRTTLKGFKKEWTPFFK
jgi:hypothetical protein